MRFTHGRNFHICCKISDAGIVPLLHVRSLPIKNGRVVYQCVAYCKEEKRADVFLEVSGLLHANWISKYYENIVGEAVECMMLRTNRQSKKLLYHMRTLENREVTESGENDDLEGLHPPWKLDAVLSRERSELRRRLRASEKKAAARLSVVVDPVLTSGLGAERLRDTAYAENYWRRRFLAFGTMIAEMQVERGGPPSEAWVVAKYAFMDLQRQVASMDERAHEKMFELYDLRMVFDKLRTLLEDAGETVGAWDEWVVPRVDRDGCRDVVRLHVLLGDSDKEVDDEAGEQRECGSTEEELVMAKQSEDSAHAVVIRAACMEIEGKYKEISAGYEAIDRVYCQTGLRKVLFEQEMKMMRLDCQVRRATDACARLRAEAVSLK